jgi:uncharacterized OB-fold protein
MTLSGEYLGMPVSIPELDRENHAFYSYCGRGELRLQRCQSCQRLRTPPTTACPFCTAEACDWVPVSGKGTVYSYGEVHHAIQPAFREFSPYALLLVELDEQQGEPGEHDGLRMIGNLATESGDLAPPELVRSVGIGTRLKVVFRMMGEGVALPLWQLDPDAAQPARPWRYPIE